MASAHPWIVALLCILLAAVNAILGVEVSENSSSPPELRNANYIQLQDLIRQQILGVIDNGADKSNAGVLSDGDVPTTGTQVRHLGGGPRGRRWRNLIFGSEDGTRPGLNKFRRPPPQSNRVEGMYDYFGDNVGADYQNRYPPYDYLPSRNQIMYDMNGRRPSPMWSGSGMPSDYVLNDPPPRSSFRRPGMRPTPSESYNFVDNGDQMPTIESLVGGPGTYLVQVPARGKRNNLNGPMTMPSTQTISSGSDGYTVIPIDLFGLDGFSNNAGIPIRINGNGNTPNQISRVSIPGAQSQPPSIVSTNTDVPDRSNIEVAPGNGGQTFTIPTAVPGSGGSKGQLPRVEVGGDGVNVVPGIVKNQISRVSIPDSQSLIPENSDMLDTEGLTSNVKLPSMNARLPSVQTLSIPTRTSGSGGSRMQLPLTGNDGLNMNSMDVVPELERISNGAGMPIKRNNQNPNQNTRVSIPGSQYFIPENVDMLDTEGLTNNVKLPSMNARLPSVQTLSKPTGTSGSGGGRIQLPLAGNDGLNMNSMDVVPELERISNGAGMPIRRNNQNSNEIKRVSIPGSQFAIPENVDIPNLEGSSTNIKLPSMNGGQSSQQTFIIPTESVGSGGSRIQLPVNEGDLQFDEGLLRNADLPVSFNRLGGQSGSRVISGGSNDLPGLDSFRIGSDGSGQKGLNNLELPTSVSGMRTGTNQITVPSSVSYNFAGGEPISTVGLPMDTSRTPASFRITSAPTSIQSSPTVMSTNDADAQPDYDIDIRHSEEPSYATSITTESSNADSTPTSPTVSDQPSELVSTTIPDVESPINLVNQEMPSVANEPTNVVSDMSPSKMLTATEDNGRALNKGPSKTAGGFFPSFRWSKSSNPPTASTDENEILTSNAAELQTNVDEQMNAKLAQTEILTDGRDKNAKIQMEPGMSAMNFVQNQPESFNMNGNAMGSRRRGANQQGNYYIIQRPDDFLDTTYESQLRPQTGKFGTRSQVQQSMDDVGAQNIGFGQPQNMVKGGMTRMMSSAGAEDGSGTFNGAAGRSGRQRQYKVLVVDSDHELLRGLNLPGLKSANSGVSGEV